jgi:hypothetical protein
MINTAKDENKNKSKSKFQVWMNNIEIIHFYMILVHENVLQKQVLYLQLHNQFLTLEHDRLEHELILK